MKPMCPIHLIIDSSAFFDVLLMLIICWILVDHVMNLCLGRVVVSVLKLKCHPRIIFVSDNPPSAANLFFAIIGLQGIGLFLSFGWASISIASGIAASNSQSVFLLPGRSTYILLCCWCNVVSRLVMYPTKILMYRTMVLLARLTKVRC